MIATEYCKGAAEFPPLTDSVCATGSFASPSVYWNVSAAGLAFSGGAAVCAPHTPAAIAKRAARQAIASPGRVLLPCLACIQAKGSSMLTSVSGAEV